MNVFYLNQYPDFAAEYHGDKHVLGQILNTCRILWAAKQEVNLANVPYAGKRYRNYPWTLWARGSLANFQWLQSHFYALLDEYQYRWERKHKYEQYRTVVTPPSHAFSRGKVHSGLVTFREAPWSKPPLVMPVMYHSSYPAMSYQNYYLAEKTHLLQYTKRHVPDWVQSQGLGEHK